MSCYSGGDVLSFPATVVRGESVSCFVNASSMMWDDSLQLVVTDCRFTSSTSGPSNGSATTALTYHFIHDKYV